VHIVPADLSTPEGAERLYDEVTGRRQLKVSMLVANAGVGHTEAFVDAPFSKVCVYDVMHTDTIHKQANPS
jgi:short-subunit dehydrogenase